MKSPVNAVTSERPHHIVKRVIFTMIMILSISACSSHEDYLIRHYAGDFDEPGMPVAYLNSKGDTIIPIGKYYYAYTDTIRHFGMVMKDDGRIIGIDKNDTELFEVFKYDNGPDYLASGLFRIVKNGKIGYADQYGEIMIEPRFDCAYPFRGDSARVSDDCTTETDGEHLMWKSDHWYQIAKTGKHGKK